MDQIKIGALIRMLRGRLGMTQLELAERLNVSDKAVSKWECGRGVPDLATLPLLAESLKVDVKALMSGNLGERSVRSGDMKKTIFHICPICGNLLFSTDDADISCCGIKLDPIEAVKPTEADDILVEKSDGDWFITSDHPMLREHYISFVAFLNDNTVIVKKLYPEWDMQVRLPFFAHGKLLWYCTEHGLFTKRI